VNEVEAWLGRLDCSKMEGAMMHKNVEISAK